MNKIFISIACFMDNDIVNTIEDCLNKAKHPSNIVFGICLQSEDDDNCLNKYKDNKQFNITHINWSKARGPAYARGIIYDMFSDEDYFFQIDCHTRFYEDWDEKIIKCFNDYKKINNKAIISHYPVNINDMGKKDHIIVNISTVRCIDINMGIKTHGRFVNTSSCPKKSWGISAAMLFFDRKAYSDVPFDKDIYFGLQFEEQVVLAARYWTHGYDIFTPDEHIIATEYITNRKRQKKSVPRIPNLQKETYDRLCHIMKLKYMPQYNTSTNSRLGNERTIEDYYKMLKIYDKVKNTYPDNYLQDDGSNKNVITIGSVGFGYEFGKYFVNYILNLTFPKFTIKYDNSENCDLIIYTHFTRNQDFWNKNEKPYLMWNGERYNLPSRIRKCSNKLVVNSLDPNSNLRIPYAFFAYVEYKQRNLWLKYKNIDIANKRLFSYCISANRGSNIRNTFVEKISQKCNDVWCLGRYKVNNNIDKVDGKWNNEKLQKTYSKYKFVLASENEVKKGYITEKIINVFSSGAVPIYIGDSVLAKKIFNSKAFICLDDFDNIDDCINYVLSLSDDKIKRYLSEKIFTNNPEADIFTEYNNLSADCNKDIISKIKILLKYKEINMYNTALDKSILQSVIINLDKDKEKYENMSTKLNLFNIPYSRFNAILGKDIYDNFKSSGKIQNNGYTLRPHQVGCWQSHYKIWQHIIFNNIERLLIFEDDCFFVNDFKNLYHKTLEIIKDKEYDILFLGYSGANIVINKDLHLLDYGVPRCLHAYVLTLSGAKKLVEKMPTIDYPIDETIGRMFYRQELKGYRTSYLLVYQPWQVLGNLRDKYFPKELLYLIEEKSAEEQKKRSLIVNKKKNVYHSQTGQDKFVDNIFKQKKGGFFVDVGAHDGITINNTLYFEENHNWTGINIEPLTEVFKKLEKNRPNCININNAISENNGYAKFFYNTGHTEMLSGLVEHYDERHKRRKNIEIKCYGGESKIIDIETKRLETIFDEFDVKNIDYLSIDVEGAELSVLKSINFSKVNIHIIGFECNYIDTGKVIVKYLNKFNYKLLSNVRRGDIFMIQDTKV